MRFAGLEAIGNLKRQIARTAANVENTRAIRDREAAYNSLEKSLDAPVVYGDSIIMPSYYVYIH